MNMAPRYLLLDRFDLGMLATLTADISLTEISLEQVCELIEKAELEKTLGLHGGWANGSGLGADSLLSACGPILLVAQSVASARGTVMKWVQVEIID